MTPPKLAIYNYIRRGFDFRGRSSRSDYWWPRLFILAITALLFSLFLSGGGTEWLDAFLALADEGATADALETLPPLTSLATFAFVSLVVLSLTTFVPDLALGWRRFHDLGLPGWLHLLFAMIGLAMAFVALAELVWLAFPGKAGRNQYGPDPTENPYQRF